jgi:hypothetical protein
MKVDVDKIYGKKLEEPAFIENESDFYKVLISLIKIMSKGDYNDAEFFTMGMRILCHEYLALVLAGKMEPFTLPEDFVEREKETFKDLINYQNMMLQKAGVPMFEGDKGKVEIDIEEMKRRANGKT